MGERRTAVPADRRVRNVGLNVFVLAGFVLNDTLMFLLVRRLVGHAGAAFVSGLGLDEALAHLARRREEHREEP